MQTNGRMCVVYSPKSVNRRITGSCVCKRGVTGFRCSLAESVIIRKHWSDVIREWFGNRIRKRFGSPPLTPWRHDSLVPQPTVNNHSTLETDVGRTSRELLGKSQGVKPKHFPNATCRPVYLSVEERAHTGIYWCFASSACKLSWNVTVHYFQRITRCVITMAMAITAWRDVFNSYNSYKLD